MKKIENRLKVSKAMKGNKNSLGFKHTEETKKRISEMYKGIGNPMYGKINNKDCEGKLEAHHILSWKDYPELRYDINNGITLCHAHHPKKRAEEKRLSPYFMELVSASKK